MFQVTGKEWIHRLLVSSTSTFFFFFHYASIKILFVFSGVQSLKKNEGKTELLQATSLPWGRINCIFLSPG